MTAAVKAIKEAEDAGEALVKKATEEAQEILRCGQAEAKERGKQIRDGTRRERNEILDKARAEAEAVCVPLQNEADVAVRDILKPDKAAFNAAVEALVQKLA